MRFGVLGPVALLDGAVNHELSSRNSRTLLAAFLLQAGKTVSTSELAWTLWGFDQPSHPRRATQLAVGRLRTVLERFGRAKLLQTQADGYLLQVADEEIDVHEFEVALRKADVARGSGEPCDELRALERALAAWRGDALADVSAQALNAARVRLDERRLQTVERRNEIRLGLGRAEGLVSELSELTARYPFRERLWHQHIRALHDTGRRSEALAEYEVIRRHLAEQFGTEPGEELSALHPRLLTGTSAVQRTGRGPAAVPRQLPRAPTGRLGRDRELSVLDRLIPHPHARAPVVAAVTGPAWSGKSALVAQWARRVADTFPEGQIWINLRGSEAGRALRTEDALAWVLRGLGAHPSNIPALVDERAAVFRSMTDGLRLLLVLDDAPDADGVLPLLPGAGGTMVVVTSRDSLSELTCSTPGHAVRLDLGPARPRPRAVSRLADYRLPSDSAG